MTDNSPAQTSANDLLSIKLVLLVTAHMAGTVNVVSVMAMAPAISEDQGLTATAFGFFITAYYCAQAVWSIPSGTLVDRLGVGKTLAVSHIVMGAGSLTLVMAGSYEHSLVGMFLMGIGYSMTNPASSAGVMIWFPPERRGTAMGIKQVGVPLGGIIAAGNGVLVTSIAWQSIMLVTGAAIILNGICCLYLVRFQQQSPIKDSGAVASLWSVLKMPKIQLYTLVCAFTNTGQTNFFAFLTLFLRDVAHASQPMAAFAIGLAQASSAIARIGWGVVSDKWYRTRRGLLMAVICSAATVFFALMLAVHPGWGLGLGLLLALLLGATIASFTPVAQAITVEMVDPRLSGSAMGINMTGVHIGGMTGPPVFGYLIDATGGYDAGWLFTTAIVGIGSVLLLWKFSGKPD